jgi:hypothetical protein
MSIFISASLLEDYISCNRKVYYRVNKPEAGIQNEEMIIGEIVHKAIELYYDDISAGLDYFSSEMNVRLPSQSIEYGLLCLGNYYKSFQPLLYKDDLVEVKFKIKIDGDVFVVGKMDRVSNGNVFDWKTARSPSTNISNSIQFILYNWAFKKLYNHEASGVYYAALGTGKLLKLLPNPNVEALLINELIPSAVRDIKSKLYLRNGMFRKACYRCPYSETCLSAGG